MAERKRKVYETARILNEVVDAYRRESPEETVDHHVSVRPALICSILLFDDINPFSRTVNLNYCHYQLELNSHISFQLLNVLVDYSILLEY
jgi:hypothetical protein